MARTTLRRRKADAYRIQQPPSLQGVYDRGADQVAWHGQTNSLVYDRHRGLWRYTEVPSAIVDTGSRRDVLARSPRADLPLASETEGAEVAELLEATGWAGGEDDRWTPEVTVHCIASDPTSGTTVVWWHRSDEWSAVPGDGLTKLRLTSFDPFGQVLGSAVETLHVGGDFWWLGRINAELHGGFVYAVEPTTAAQGWTLWPTWEQQWIAMRLVKRQASSLVPVVLEQVLDDEGVGVDSLTVDVASEVPRAWVFFNRQWPQGAGPHPTYAENNAYDTSYVAPVDPDTLIVSPATQLHFGWGDADPWSFDEAQPYGDGVAYDGADAFVSIGFDPATWDTPQGNNSLWRFTLAGGGTRLTGTATPFLVDGYGRRLERTGPGEYLLYRGDQHGVTAAALVNLA